MELKWGTCTTTVDETKNNVGLEINGLLLWQCSLNFVNNGTMEGLEGITQSYDLATE